ncbi:MAG: 50S ribosomal protein L13 [Phototrophicaceae bacterium]|jgi:large subunit ribosomal protein L13
MYKTLSTKPTDIQRDWWVVDAEGQTLGRLASVIAQYLRGKNKPYYTPNLDCGDFVIVVNAEKIHVTSDRLDTKMYYRYSGYPSGLSERTLRDILARHPERAIELAVKGMVPSNSALARQALRKLKVYAGPSHPHEAQSPKPLDIQTRRKGAE